MQPKTFEIIYLTNFEKLDNSRHDFYSTKLRLFVNILQDFIKQDFNSSMQDV